MCLTFDANNRINNGIETYDAAGNMLTDGFHTYTYDAENRIACVDNGAAVYQYDAEGRRVRKITGASSCGATTGGLIVDYLYDLSGRPVTMWCAKCSWGSGWYEGDVWAGGRHLATYADGTLFFNHSDWLGTERARTQNNGASCETITSLPFGDGMAYSGSCGDPSVHHFTGKERDAESNLDYFGARYDSSQLGRFMSADPSKLSVLPAFPQTWDRYSYVYNSPLALEDTNGKWPASIHNQIIDKAFPNLSPAQRQILKNVSANQDGVLNGGQSKELAFEHAMRAPGQSVADAQTKYTNFVQSNEDAANNLQLYMSDPGTEFPVLSPEALEAFGKALHAIEDSLSPAHAGFQVWDYNPIHIAQHYFKENSINAQQMKDAVNAARSAFNRTFGLFGFSLPLDNSSATTIQGSGRPCGGNTGIPCGQ